MSRGLGKNQRAILKIFSSNPEQLLDSIEITGLVFEKQQVNESEVSSVRRSLRKLSNSGKLVDMGRNFHDGRKRYALPEYAEQYYDRMEKTFGKDAVKEHKNN